MITRTARETVMLEALEKLVSEWGCCIEDCEANCAGGIASRAIATVKAMDEAELAGTENNTTVEVIGG